MYLVYRNCKTGSGNGKSKSSCTPDLNYIRDYSVARGTNAIPQYGNKKQSLDNKISSMRGALYVNDCATVTLSRFYPVQSRCVNFKKSLNGSVCAFL